MQAEKGLLNRVVGLFRSGTKPTQIAEESGTRFIEKMYYLRFDVGRMQSVIVGRPHQVCQYNDGAG